ncbi:MAG: DUF2065 domain-containing protein [Rhodobacteraceae bacterium]|nr:DUF2065 domain-containing protein [Paracoccaceae bacterium]
MLEAILLGIGMVLMIEGLIYALAPSRIEDLLRMLAQIPIETRRIIGFAAIVIGAVLISWAASLGI